jgi:phosphoenolpyruvate synthase/pyruvate phosphate dikinase
MVCEMTVPPWVPLFATVSGVVADSGGILSHCAIVAREFRLPAVVGTHVGTSLIRDGMTLTVDGTKGVVRTDAGCPCWCWTWY